MAIVRYTDPFRDMAMLQDRINRLSGDTFRQDDDVTRGGSWIPPVDIYENDKHELVLVAELPDMTRDDIDVTVENSTLTIRGEKKMSGDVREEQYRRIERNFGAFSRSFTLPSTVDATKVRAEYKNGVLMIRLPLREEAKPRQVKVEVAA